MENHEITQLLQKMSDGDSASREAIVHLLYGELRQIARSHLRSERSAHTLQATALVNEAYMKVFARGEPKFADRVHFLATMSVAMRRILVDYARARNGPRRGGGQVNLALTPEVEPPVANADLMELLALDAALTKLAAEKEVVARLLEMHYFAGMTAEEAAQATGISPHMVRQRIRFGQAWLRQHMGTVDN